MLPAERLIKAFLHKLQQPYSSLMIPESILRRCLFLSSYLAIALGVIVWAGCSSGHEQESEERIALAQAILARANEAAFIFNFNQAHQLYLQARDLVPEDSEIWIEATYGAAIAGWHSLPPNRNSILESQALFETLSERLDTDSKFLPRVLLNLARLHEQRNFPGDPVNAERAAEYYRGIQARWPNSVIADEAAGRLAANGLHNFQNREAVRESLDTLRKYLAERPDSRIASVLWYFLGESYWNFLQDARQSFDAFEQAIEHGLVERARTGFVYARMASLAENHLNEPVTAAKYNLRIIRETPRFGGVYEAQLALSSLANRYPEILEHIPDEIVHKLERNEL